jgi:hypothetical protein
MAEAKRVTSFVVTLSGGADQVTVPSVDVRVGLREIAFQADPTNTAECYVGGPTVAASNGMQIPKPVTNIPVAPFVLGEFDDGSIDVQDFYLFGTLNDKVHVLVLAYV